MGRIVETLSVFDNLRSAQLCYSFLNTQFDWTLVRSFLAALDHGSLLGAARALGTSQPTLGRHIAQLEAQLGVLLFERTGRGLRPTEMAQQLGTSARQMEASALQIAHQASGAEAAVSGTVRITTSQPVACYLMPPILAQLRATLPHVQVELVSSNEVTNLLRREADIALRMVQPRQATIVARRIGKITLGVYAHRDYLRRRGIPREPNDLLAHELIGNDRHDNIVKGAAALGVPLRRESFGVRTDDLVAYWHAVRAGLGIGFVADYLARTDPAVVPLLPALRIPPIPMWLAVHREIRTNARVRAVFDFLAQAAPRAL